MHYEVGGSNIMNIINQLYEKFSFVEINMFENCQWKVLIEVEKMFSSHRIISLFFLSRLFSFYLDHIKTIQ